MNSVGVKLLVPLVCGVFSRLFTNYIINEAAFRYNISYVFITAKKSKRGEMKLKEGATLHDFCDSFR